MDFINYHNWIFRGNLFLFWAKIFLGFKLFYQTFITNYPNLVFGLCLNGLDKLFHHKGDFTKTNDGQI